MKAKRWRASKLRSFGVVTGGLAFIAFPLLLRLLAGDGRTWRVNTSDGNRTFDTKQAAEEYVQSFPDSDERPSHISMYRLPSERGARQDMLVWIHAVAGCMIVARGIWRWFVPFAVLANGVLLIRPDYSSRIAIDIAHTPLSIRGASIVLNVDRETPVKLNQLTSEDRSSLIAAIKDARRQGEEESRAS